MSPLTLLLLFSFFSLSLHARRIPHPHFPTNKMDVHQKQQHDVGISVLHKIVSAILGAKETTRTTSAQEVKTRSMLGSGSEGEEAVSSAGNDTVEEDIAVMDYAQPHRKPPIHNEKH